MIHMRRADFHFLIIADRNQSAAVFGTETKVHLSFPSQSFLGKALLWKYFYRSISDLNVAD